MTRFAKASANSGLCRLGPLLVSLAVSCLLGCGQQKPATAAKATNAATQSKSQTNKPTPQSNTNAPAHAVEIPKSVFVTDPAAGKDPFFPNSTRRAQAATPKTGSKTEPVSVNVAASLNLIGISGFGNEWVAIVNDAILEAGKSAEITLTQGDKMQKVKVRCLKITKKSVLLSAEGQAKPIELRLP